MNLIFDYDLTSQQQRFFNELIDKHQINNKNLKAMLKYYKHFVKILHLQKIDGQNSKNIKLIIQISLIFTQKSNFYRTIQGIQFPGICFSMNDILKNKSYTQINELIQLTGLILGRAKFKEEILKKQVQNLISQIQIGLNEAVMFQRLILVFLRNTIQNSLQIIKFKQKIVIYAWYLYIDSKNQQFFTQNQKKYLILSIVQTVVLYSLSEISPLILQKGSPRNYGSNVSKNSHRKTMIENIFLILFEQCQMEANQIIEYQKVNQKFDLYFDYLIENLIIRSIQCQQFNILSAYNLQINLRKIDRKINKQLQFNQIDLRKFISYDLYNERDYRKTAIQDKIILKRNKIVKEKLIKRQNKQKTYKSHRVLNLQSCDLELSNSFSNQQSQIHLPCYVSKAGKMNIPFLHRVSETDQLTYYIMQSTRPFICQHNNYQASIMNFINFIFDSLYKEQSHCQYSIPNSFEVYQFYQFLVNRTWVNSYEENINNYILEQNQITHKCLLILSIYAIANKQRTLKSIGKFIQCVHLESEESSHLLFTIGYLIGTAMPKKLVDYFLLLQSYLINVNIWTDNNVIQALGDFSQDLRNKQTDHQNQSMNYMIESLIKNINQKSQYFITGLFQNYLLRNSSIINKWKTRVIMLTVGLIVFQPQIIENRILDQIILCSMFAASKMLKINVKFQQIIEIYKNYLKDNQILFQKVIFDISIYENLFRTIIHYYNAQFIKYLGYKNQQQNQGLLFDYFAVNQLGNQVFSLTQQSNNKQQQITKIMIFSPQNKQVSYGPFMFQRYANEKQNEYQQSNKIIQSSRPNKPNRNPTRIKERKSLYQRQRELCVTQKVKHPIFQQFKNQDQLNQQYQ